MNNEPDWVKKYREMPFPEWPPAITPEEIISIALDADVDTKDPGNLFLSWRIADDPLVAGRISDLSAAWHATNPYAELNLCEVARLPVPDFVREAVKSLTRQEKLALRKRVF
jgi:hypothetical protein